MKPISYMVMRMPLFRMWWAHHRVRRSYVLALFVGLVAALLITATPRAEAEPYRRTVALVIGNADYATLQKLATPANDAAAVNAALRDLGYDVFLGQNLNRQATEALTKKFLGAAVGADVAVVYYSGHGVQVGGVNYMLPVNARLKSPYDVENEAVDVDHLLQYVTASAKSTILFMESGRDTPFRISDFWIGDELKPVSGQKGLAKAEAPAGVALAYAAAPGSIVAEPTGRLSPFTAALVDRLPAPDRDLAGMLGAVRDRVAAATGGLQTPWYAIGRGSPILVAASRDDRRIEPMVKLTLPKSAEPRPLELALPKSIPTDGIAIGVERLPTNGTIALDGRPIGVGDTLSAKDFQALTWLAAEGAARMDPGTLVYSAREPKGASAIGAVRIRVVEALADNRASDTEATVARHATAVDGPTVELGVGPVPIPVNLVPSALPQGMPLQVTALPDAGIARLAARPLSVGVAVLPDELKTLTFEPQTGTEGRRYTLAMRIASDQSADAVVQIVLSASVNACDTLAGEPLDLQGVTAGRLPDQIDGKAAEQACKAALDAHPEVARFRYQYGRALLALGRTTDARAEIEAASKAGHIRADCELGQLAEFGAGGTADYAAANRFYRRGADKGDPYCLKYLGTNLYFGRGAKADTRKGLDDLLRAAELGHTYAMNALGEIFLHGEKIKADPERGIRFYEAGVERQDIYSYNNLGLVYLRGTGRKADPARAFELFQRAATNGHPFAPTNLGRMYRDGVGVGRDPDKALDWLKQGAERGDYWGALDAAHLLAAKDPRNAEVAVMLATAVAHDRGRNQDSGHAAAKELSALPLAVKQAALGQLAPGGAAAGTKDINDKLVAAARAAWIARNPRYDLY